MVVLPVPGGPQRIIDESRRAAAMRRIGPSGPSRWSCPTTSSRLCGRSRSAIGGGHGEAASAFYAKAFGAEEIFRTLADDGKRLLHCRLAINGDVVMFSDDFPEMRGGATAPAPAGVVLHLQVDDADAWAKR